MNRLIDTGIGKLNVAAHLGIALGIVIQIATGVDSYPTVPPGAVLAVVLAAVLALARWRYIAVLGLIFPVWIAIGSVVDAGSRHRITHPGTVGPFVGTLVQVVAVAVGVVTGLVLTIAALRGARHDAAQPGTVR